MPFNPAKFANNLATDAIPAIEGQFQKSAQMNQQSQMANLKNMVYQYGLTGDPKIYKQIAAMAGVPDMEPPAPAQDIEQRVAQVGGLNPSIEGGYKTPGIQGAMGLVTGQLNEDVLKGKIAENLVGKREEATMARQEKLQLASQIFQDYMQSRRDASADKRLQAQLDAAGLRQDKTLAAMFDRMSEALNKPSIQTDTESGDVFGVTPAGKEAWRIPGAKTSAQQKEQNKAEIKSQTASQEFNNQLDNIKEELNQNLNYYAEVPSIAKGPVLGKITNAVGAENFSPAIKTFNTSARMTAVKIARLLEGSRMSDQDRAFYLQNVANLEAGGDSAKAATDALVKWLDNMKKKPVSFGGKSSQPIPSTGTKIEVYKDDKTGQTAYSIDGGKTMFATEDAARKALGVK